MRTPDTTLPISECATSSPVSLRPALRRRPSPALALQPARRLPPPFGTPAADMWNPGTDLKETICGTRAYMAPEVMSSAKGAPPTAGDMWSAGVCLYTLLQGRLPFKNKDHAQHLRDVLECNLKLESAPCPMTARCRDFIEALVHVDAHTRLTGALRGLPPPPPQSRPLTSPSDHLSPPLLSPAAAPSAASAPHRPTSPPPPNLLPLHPTPSAAAQALDHPWVRAGLREQTQLLNLGRVQAAVRKYVDDRDLAPRTFTNQVIVQQGARNPFLFMIIKGTVEVIVQGGSGGAENECACPPPARPPALEPRTP